MTIVELFLIAISISMDAFAVAICMGLGMSKLNIKNGLIISLFFGVFQGVMPVIGWLLGIKFIKYIASFDHWVAFILLAFIGLKMIYEAFHPEEEIETNDKLDYKELTLMSIATSIDALAVGITFAIVPNVNMYLSFVVITLVAIVFSFGGVVIGNKFGNRFQQKAEILGGIILCILGLRIVIMGV